MDETRRVMKIRKYTGTIMATLLLISCGGSAEQKTAAPSMDGVVRVTTYDSQKFDADMYEAKEGLVQIEYLLDGFQSHTLVIEGMEDEFKLEVGDEKTAFGEIELKAGRYILYCDIAGHRTSGMEAKLLVS
ncbi:MAG: hypothetical protein QGF06_02885 [Acidimicrobiales bacterium]|jgi:plastocyanin|nr:hypothetical protein [Acidimicrobiales bacterium]MDP6894375.1 hypothetical protein [Acidimicrobiales bacterium]HJM37553.1 hypothetical protein [Acidimicrobiales bacterium]|tara:strand:- start:2305 stop:2697 length:393 start_codon:yes stop_codon:yes gene_type:complete